MPTTMTIDAGGPSRDRSVHPDTYPYRIAYIGRLPTKPINGFLVITIVIFLFYFILYNKNRDT